MYKFTIINVEDSKPKKSQNIIPNFFPIFFLVYEKKPY
jgi:hypothetical protein